MEIGAVEIKEKIAEADLVLIGIGEEFEQQAFLKKNEKYQEVCEVLSEKGMTDLLPYINVLCLKEKAEESVTAMRNLLEIVKEKNYFIVSTCMNDFIRQAGFRLDRITQPCGGYEKMQCSEGCEKSLMETDATFLAQVREGLEGKRDWDKIEYPVCPECGRKMCFNSLYASGYNEGGYLDSWDLYRKWLQGTLNKKVCILELGVGLKYPSVIRWPFEKTGYLNQKACFIRVHENLYQLPPELKENGYYVPKNALELLNLL